MGLFDTVHCEYPLPNAAHQDLEFQTKSLESLLDTYTLTRDGRLMRHARRGGRGGLDRDIEWPLHGDIRIYTSLRPPAGEREWVEYVVRFTHGRVEWIRPLQEVPPTPEDDGIPPAFDWEPVQEPFPPQPEASSRDEAGAAAGGAADPGPSAPPADDGAPLGPEETLLENLRRDRGELEKLLAASDDHWGYEDPVYRFYHQSFKVYWLQQRTQAIVERLQTLAPDRPLNPWFVAIVQSGTGKKFAHEDNARWTEVTRPILEAFFHARFFLEMAVRYADLAAPPQPLPSGYAALLYLFGLR